MPAPTIKTPPESQVVDEGASAKFTAEADGDTPLTFSWKRGDGEWKADPPGDSKESSYTIAATSSQDNGLRIRVKVKNEDGESEESAATLTVRAKEEVVLWVTPFAYFAAAAVAVAAVILLVPVVLGLVLVLTGELDEAAFATTIALVLLAIGIFVVAAGVFLALVDFRGRARTLKEIRDLLKPSGDQPQIDSTALPELVKALPESLKAFGTLRAMAAVLSIAAVLFICGTAIAWQLADPGRDEGPTTTTTGTTTTETTTATEPTTTAP